MTFNVQEERSAVSMVVGAVSVLIPPIQRARITTNSIPSVILLIYHLAKCVTVLTPIAKETNNGGVLLWIVQD